MWSFERISASERSEILSVLVAVPFFSLTGLFGKFIPLSPLLIVQWRTIFAFVTLLLVLLIFRKKILFSNYRQCLWLILSGSILGLHWLAFFKSIQLSTVAIGLLSFAIYPLFTTIFEPIFFKESFRLKNIFSTLIVIFGLVLIVTSKSDGNEIIIGSVLKGVLLGITAGMGFAILTLLNRLYVRNQSPLALTLWQNGFAALILLPWSIFESSKISGKDWGLLFLLGVVCTVGGHTLLINGLRHVRAQLASVIIAGMEPVVAILFAILLLGEIPSLRTILGGILILGTTIFITTKPS